MILKNTKYHYGIVSIFFHWFMAFLIIVLLVLGLYMTSLPNVGFNTKKISLILLHKELGMLVLVLVTARLGWRLGNVVPLLAEGTPPWQKFAARFVHLAFYGFLFALPITGWLMSSAAGFPVTFLGIVLPNLISQNIYKVEIFIQIHQWLAYGLILMILVHVSAALLHHFIYKDDTLRKMLP